MVLPLFELLDHLSLCSVSLDKGLGVHFVQACLVYVDPETNTTTLTVDHIRCISDETHHEKTCFLLMQKQRKTKEQISCEVTNGPVNTH